MTPAELSNTEDLGSIVERLRRAADAEALGGLGTWEHDFLSGEVYSSEENRRLFFGADRTRGRNFDDYAFAIHPADRQRVLQQREELMAGRGSPDAEFRVVWPDGSVHWIHGRKQIVRDEAGKPLRQFGTNLDITERKRTEDELQSLSRRLIEAQEAERRAVARELHDDLGQLLTAVRLNLQRSGDNSESIALVDEALARMPDLALDLRPTMLDDLGLAAALRWYVAREAKRAGIESRLEVENLPRLPAALETTCFRLIQEALTNVARHAAARVVEVQLGVRGDLLQLSVRDDGSGFDTREVLQRAAEGRSLGLLGMKERVSLARGELEIDSAPGRGTAIRARFPLKESTDGASHPDR